MENFTFHYYERTVTLPSPDGKPPYAAANKLLWEVPNSESGAWMEKGFSGREYHWVEMFWD